MRPRLECQAWEPDGAESGAAAPAPSRVSLSPAEPAPTSFRPAREAPLAQQAEQELPRRIDCLDVPRSVAEHDRRLAGAGRKRLGVALAAGVRPLSVRTAVERVDGAKRVARDACRDRGDLDRGRSVLVKLGRSVLVKLGEHVIRCGRSPCLRFAWASSGGSSSSLTSRAGAGVRVHLDHGRRPSVNQRPGSASTSTTAGPVAAARIRRPCAPPPALTRRRTPRRAAATTGVTQSGFL